jgi:acetyl-CoA synthetase
MSTPAGTPAASFAWQPTEDFKAAANWQAFLHAERLPDYPALARRAAAEPEWFWNALIRFLGVRFVRPYSRVLDLAQGIEWPRWCIGGTLNATLSCLDRHVATARRDHAAIVWESEDGAIRTWTYADLHAETCRLAAGLAHLGLRAGDAVGLFMPMMPETAAAFLALARLGCVALPLFSGFGAAAIATRLNDGNAVAAITVDACLRRGRTVPMKATLDEAAREVPNLRHVVVARRLADDAPMQAGRDVWWHDLVARAEPSFPAVELDAEAPLLVVYTSGTTGRPKGTVHTHCGFTVKTGEDFLLCFDLKPTDRMLWMTDMGWLVGPIQIVAATLAGATLVMAEGTPDYPEPGRLWRLIEAHEVSFLGLSPTIARILARHGDHVVARHDLSTLRVAASTGEPWDPQSWSWVFEKVLGRRGPLMNYSGGTEMGGLVATNILFPIKPASFFGPIPGTGADIVDADGRSVATGEVGELVMREACIGTTRGLWRDPQRYLESYWRRIPGMWVHGDWASRDADGCWHIHGRSDDTIKIAGKRTGPAEIEALVLATRRVTDAAAVAVPDPTKGSAVVCAVVAAPGETADAALADVLAAAVVAGLGPPFRPSRVVFVSDLPKTRNMKTMRRVVRAAITGDPAGDLTALVNPEAVDELRRAVAGG